MLKVEVGEFMGVDIDEKVLLESIQEIARLFFVYNPDGKVLILNLDSNGSVRVLNILEISMTPDLDTLVVQPFEVTDN